MKRSKFIYLSLVSTAAIALPSLHCSSNRPSKVLSQPLFLSHICDEKTLREIGDSYKNQFSSQTKEDKLTDILLTDSTGKKISQKDNLLVTSLLNRKIQQDFETGKTVVIKGWVLSATEAQQCALFSLS